MKLFQSTDGNRVNKVEFDQYELTVEPNADSYRGGFTWSVCLKDQELGYGLEPSFRLAEKAANNGAHSFLARFEQHTDQL